MTTSPSVRPAFDVRPAVFQVIDAAGCVVGVGWLAGPGLVVTCAHVVTQAGGGPGRDILLRAYPHAADPGAPVLAGVVDPGSWREPDGEDVAFVTLTEAPTNVPPLVLDQGRPADGREVTLFGFPMQALDRGHHGFGRVGGDVTGNAGQRLLQLTGCHEVTSGFSGGPVVDSITGHVVGMVDSVPGDDPLGRGRTTAYVTPVQTLRELWPGLPVPEIPCPFNGLDAFTEDRAAWFVGRDRAVSDVLAALRHNRARPELISTRATGDGITAMAAGPDGNRVFLGDKHGAVSVGTSSVRRSLNASTAAAATVQSPHKPARRWAAAPSASRSAKTALR